MALADEKYMLLTTFRRDGTPVSSPVWVVGLDAGKVAFYTSSASGKAKRLAHTARVTVQPSDARGRPKAGTTPAEGTAQDVTGAIRGKVVAKYGVMTKVAGVFNTIGGAIKRRPMPYADRGVVISLTG
jgi:PPOX class probable F420-dependent enzyme